MGCLDISLNSQFSPSEIIVVSNFVQEYVRENFRRESQIIPPPINLNEVIYRNDKKPKYITMFNPNLKKGGNIFRDVAHQMPTHNFAVVLGWDILKEGITTDNEMLKRLCESLRIEYKGQRIDDVDFSDLPNVKVFPFTYDVSDIYAQSRIICVPSQWQEAYGRVSIEAMANSIPVIGSDVGGLSEIVHTGGVVVKDYQNPKKWIAEIQKLDDKQHYFEISQRGREYIDRNYNFTKICEDFLDIIEKNRFRKQIAY